MIGARFMLHIKLRFSDSSPKLPANFVENFTDESLKRSSLQNWKTLIIVAKEWEDNNTSFLITVLQHSYKNVAYDYILNLVQKALSSTWKLRYNHHIYKLYPTFDKNIIYIETFVFPMSQVTTMKTVYEEDTLDLLKRKYHFFTLRRDLEDWKLDMRIHGKAMDITKLSFCSLLELESTEYTRNGELITLTSTNRTLSHGEFLTVIGQDGEIRPRICVQDMYPDNAGPENDCSCSIFISIVLIAVLMT